MPFYRNFRPYDFQPYRNFSRNKSRKSGENGFHIKFENAIKSLKDRKLLTENEKYSILCFDLETNKLGTDAEIVQLAVVDAM